MVEQSTTEPEPEAPQAITPAALSAYMAALGRKGGKTSGKRRMTNLTAKKRKAIAKKAAAARWEGHAKKTTN